MIDIIYITATLLFFALMLVFVKACDRLGQSADIERASESLR